MRRSFAQKVKRGFWKKERKEAEKEVRRELENIKNPPKWWFEIDAIKKLNERTGTSTGG